MYNVIVRLPHPPHPQSRNSQGPETFLASSADNNTRNYNTEYSNHHPSLSTLRPKRLSHSNMKWWATHTYYIYYHKESKLYNYIIRSFLQGQTEENTLFLSKMFLERYLLSHLTSKKYFSWKLKG